MGNEEPINDSDFILTLELGSIFGHVFVCSCLYSFPFIGVVKSNRSLWRLKTFTDYFWSFINIIVVFFTTMFSVSILSGCTLTCSFS